MTKEKKQLDKEVSVYMKEHFTSKGISFTYKDGYIIFSKEV